MVYEEMMGSGTTRSFLDDDIPEMSEQPLKPTQYVPTKKERVTQKLGRWADWLLRYVPEPVKRQINNAFNAFKKKVMSLFPKQQLKFEESKNRLLRGSQKNILSKRQIKPLTPRRF